MWSATSDRRLTGRAPSRIRQFLKLRRTGAAQKGIRTLVEINAFFAHALCQAVVLGRTDARREQQVGAHAHEHRPPALIVYVKVVLHHPALRELQMPAVIFLMPDGD